MVFSDLFFLFVFIPSFALLYIIAGFFDRKLSSRGPATSSSASIPQNTLKNYILILFSLIFYAWGEPVYVFLMIISVLINYLIGLWITSAEHHRRLSLAVGVTCNLLILCVFKYLNFLSDTLCGLGIQVPNPHIALPIGISFYIFQSISYLVDVYRKEAVAQRKFTNLLLYISMFPQLIAGPIVRYGTIANEINDRHTSANDIAEGSFRFLVGLGKKVIIANQLSEISTQFLGGSLDNLSTAGSWVGIIAFTLQIYFDFSGYSDMAIGMARCMGFHFNENFNHPYCCNTITDFWRRWHISLGSFFRDYVYIPMGGNKHHQMMNIFVVWFLTGMWHGASWNFIIWGVYFGIIVAVEKFTILRVKDKIPSFLLHIYSILLVVIGWGIFYFDDFNSLGVFFKSFFGNTDLWTDFTVSSAIMNHFWLWVVAIIFCMPIRRGVEGRLGQKTLLVSRLILSVLILILSAALLVGATNNAFIYTRF